MLLLYVQRAAPAVTQVSPAAGEVGATCRSPITGTNLTGAALVITGTDVDVSDVATPNDTTLTATLTIARRATPSAEARLLIVTTESGQTTIEFFVVPPGMPTVTAILPGAGEPGADGARHAARPQPDGRDGQRGRPPTSRSEPVVVDDETITLEVVHRSRRPRRRRPHARRSPPAAARRSSASSRPDRRSSTPRARRSATAAPLVTVRFDGVNLASIVPGTGVDPHRAEITESNALALDDRRAQATLDLDPTANIGASRDVTITTGAGSFTRTAPSA